MPNMQQNHSNDIFFDLCKQCV